MDGLLDHEHEFLSYCCGQPEMGAFPSLCSACHDHNGFECECGCWRMSREDVTQARVV